MVLYREVFFENLVVGGKVACGVIVSSVVNKFIHLHNFPFWNRAFEVGVYNIIQSDYYSFIPLSDFGSPVNNFIYRGIFQSAKWLPNRHIQNYANKYLHGNPFKAFLVPLSGMTPFFMIGAIESIIKDQKTKLCLFSAKVILLSLIPFIYSVETIKTSDGAVYLSAPSTLEALAGLIASFAINDLAHITGITNQLPKIISLGHLTGLSIIVPEIYNLATDQNAVSDSLNNLENQAMMIAGFSLAKAVAVTTTNFAYYNPMVAVASGIILLYEGYNIYNDVVFEGKELEIAIYDSSMDLLPIAINLGVDYVSSIFQ